jgi:hypothetical protein
VPRVLGPKEDALINTDIDASHIYVFLVCIYGIHFRYLYLVCLYGIWYVYVYTIFGICKEGIFGIYKWNAFLVWYVYLVYVNGMHFRYI